MSKNNSDFCVNDVSIYDIIDHVNASIYWKNLDEVYLGCNKYMLEMLNIQDRSLVLGKTDYELSWGNLAKVLDEHDKIALRDGVYSVEENYINHLNEKRTFLTKKSRLLNREGKIIGTMGTSVDITADKEAEELKLQKVKDEAKIAKFEIFKTSIDQILSILHHNQVVALQKDHPKSIANTTPEQIKLTKRESEVLYYISQGNSAKDVANALEILENKSISPATVLSIICKQLYPKFQVYGISELIKKAKLMKILPFLPNNVLSKT